MIAEPLTLIFTGPQGAGKGTQVNLILDYLKDNDIRPVLHSDSGVNFRAMKESDSLTGQLVRSTLDAGQLQPFFLASYMWTDRFVHELTDESHLVIDGTPRSLGEANNLADAFAFYGRKACIIDITLTEEETLKRLLARGRSDDSEEAIKRRLQWTKDHVMPAIDMLEKESDAQRHIINGNQTVEEVHSDIKKALNLS